MRGRGVWPATRSALCRKSHLHIFVGILAFFVILAVLILVHELGHFTFAKLMGVRVDEFGLGFPPRLKSWKRGQTIYSLNAIPLGGFVKMRGENGEDEEADSFGSKAPWQRFIILIAGPTMNLLLAVGIFFFTFLGGAPRVLTVVSQVASHSPAALAGLQPGDEIVAVNGKNVQYFADLHDITAKYLGHRVSLTVQRRGVEFSTSLVPRIHHPPNQGAMGVTMEVATAVSYSPATALHMSLEQVGLMIGTVPTLINSLSQHGTSQVAGPIGIAQQTTDVVHSEPRYGIGPILQFVALLSANLGVLNLLPIPALDGGRIVFVLLSWIRRRNLDPEVEGLIHMVGMAALLMLIMFISYQDVLRWVSGGSF